MDEPRIAEAAVPLLRGVVYADSHAAAWNALLSIPNQVRDHLSALGVEVVIDEAEGYAFLRNAEADPEGPDLPRLVSRRPLTYRVSLLLVLLRRRLLELDSQGDETRLIVTRDEAVELVRTYHPARSNEAKLADEVEADLRKLAELGFTRSLREQPHTYEVRRIVKAFVDAQWLSDFNDRVQEYITLGSQS
ncbi:MAG TPA: DUF4194 domain-containing protein [Actinomycetota bacterium]|nr:DUF4194 domain-containing protein [Actinomycetota bacterium]